MFFFVYHLFLGLVYLLFSKLVKSSTCSLKVFLAFLFFFFFVSSKSSLSLPYSALKDKTVALYLVKRGYNYNVLLQFK